MKKMIVIACLLLLTLPFVGRGQDHLRETYSLEDYDTSGQTIYLIYQNAFGGWYIKAIDTTDERVSYVHGDSSVSPYQDATDGYSTWGTSGNTHFGSYYDRFTE